MIGDLFSTIEQSLWEKMFRHKTLFVAKLKEVLQNVKFATIKIEYRLGLVFEIFMYREPNEPNDHKHF